MWSAWVSISLSYEGKYGMHFKSTGSAPKKGQSALGWLDSSHCTISEKIVLILDFYYPWDSLIFLGSIWKFTIWRLEPSLENPWLQSIRVWHMMPLSKKVPQGRHQNLEAVEWCKLNDKRGKRDCLLSKVGHSHWLKITGHLTSDLMVFWLVVKRSVTALC